MKDQIAVAAKWWADQFRNGTKQDNGDVMTTMFATLCAGAFSVTPEHADAFESALIEALPEHLGKTWKADDPRFGSSTRALMTDYGADMVLSAAAKSAGIQSGCPPFPMKTVMWIDPDKVRVRHGYAAQPIELWPNDQANASERSGDSVERFVGKLKGGA